MGLFKKVYILIYILSIPILINFFLLFSKNSSQNSDSKTHNMTYGSINNLKYNYFNCKNAYKELKQDLINSQLSPNDQQYNYSAPADKKFHEIRFLRGVIMYFPLKSINNFKGEFKWLYRSWIYMIKYEPEKWRTDLIVFIENGVNVEFNSSRLFLEQLNCRFENRRQSAEDKPMCTLINYVPLNKRTFNTTSNNNNTSNTLNTNSRKFSNEDDKYRYLLNEVDIFKTGENSSLEFDTFYKLMKQSLSKYGYSDSILIAFEGYIS